MSKGPYVFTLTADQVAGIRHAISFMCDGAWNECDYKAMADTNSVIDMFDEAEEEE